MTSSASDQPNQLQALERLAKERDLQVQDVVRLYEESVATLASKARIDQFLHIFAMRDLKDRLGTRQ